MKAWIFALLVGLLLPHVAVARSADPAIVAVFSAYQSEVISHKIAGFLDAVAQVLRRPVHVVVVSGADGMQQLLQSQRFALVFLPDALVSPALVPLVQTDVPLALYARPGPADLSDLKTISIPHGIDANVLMAELKQRNPALVVTRQQIGVMQLRALVSGFADAAVMSVGLYRNLAPSLRRNYMRRHLFAHQQHIVAQCTRAFTPHERDQLKALLLALPASAEDELHRTFGVTRFQALAAAPGVAK